MAAPSARPKPPLRAAVVGSGTISHEHLSFLAGRTTVGPVADRAMLLAVCDLSPVAAEYAATEFGASERYTDITAMLAEARPDVVHVLTPPDTHTALVAQCLEAGAHVICEKPVAPTSAELESLLSLAERSERQLTECHNYLYNTPILEISELIGQRRLGAVREVDIRLSLPVTDPSGRFGDPNLPSPIHRMPAGVVHDFTTHLVSLLLHLAPKVAYERVAAAWSRHGDNELFPVDDLDAVLIGEGPEGSVHGRLRFDAQTFPDTFEVTVRGTAGWAATDLFQPHLHVVRSRPGGGKLTPIINHVLNGSGLVQAGLGNLGRRIVQQGQYEGLHRLLDKTYTALASGGELPVAADDMRAVALLVDQLLADGVSL